MAGLNDNGWDVCFMSKEGSWAEHRKKNENVLDFERVGGRFELVVGEVAETRGKDRPRPPGAAAYRIQACLPQRGTYSRGASDTRAA